MTSSKNNLFCFMRYLHTNFHDSTSKYCLICHSILESETENWARKLKENSKYAIVCQVYSILHIQLC